MADNAVNLEILVEIQDALKRLGDFEKKSAESLGSVEKAFGAIKTAAVAAVGIIAGREVIRFFKEGIDSAVAQEQALAKLATQLEQTGENTDEAIKAFSDLGDALEKTSKFEDDAVIAAGALAKSFGLTNDQALELTKASVELASVTGDSLDSATRKLALTYSGVTGKLDEQVPAVKALTKAQLANGDAVKIILDRYAGSAQREIQTFSGSIGQTEKAFGNLQEALATSIIQSPVVIAAIQAVGEGFGRLQAYVDDNKAAIDGFVSGTVKALAVGVPIAVDATGLLIKAFQGLTLAGSLVFSGLLDVTATFGKAYQATIGVVQDATLGFVESIVKVASETPLLSEGFGLIGVSLEDSAAAVTTFREGYSSAISEGIAGTEALRDKTAQFAVDAIDKFGSFNQSFDAFAAGVTDVTQGIFDADEKVIASGKKVAAARRDVVRATAQDAKELEKARDEAKKFLEGVANDAAGEAEKLLNKRAQDLARLREFQEKGVISAQEAADAEVRIREVAQQKVDKIFDEEDAKYAAQLKERLDKFRQTVSEAAATPFKAVVGEVQVAPAALQGLESTVGATVGTLGKILDGKAGAKSLIAEGAGAFADSFIPGIGGAVGSIVGKLAEGPEATKEFIKGFIDGVPDIVVAIAESAPVVVEALVDSLVNEGGMIRIAAALLKAISGEAVLKSIGKQLGIDVGEAFNADNLGKTLGGAFTSVLPDFPALFRASFEAGMEPIRRLFNGDVKGALDAAIRGPFDAVRASLPAAIREPFDAAIGKLTSLGPALGASIGGAFAGALPDFGALFRSGAGQFIEPVRALFAGDVQGAIQASFRGPIEFFRDSLPGALRAPLDGFLGRLTGAFDAFSTKLAPNFAGAADAFITPVRKLFTGDIKGALTSAFDAPIKFFRESLPAALRAPFDKFDAILSSFTGKLSAFKFPELPKFPEPGWLRPFIDAIDKLSNVGGLTGGGAGGGGGGGIPGSLGKPFGFAQGGLVPPGFPRDSFPAPGLTSGERVLTQPQDRGLMRLLEDIAAGRGVAARQPAQAAGPIQVVLQIGERELANVFVDLNRQGYRTA